MKNERAFRQVPIIRDLTQSKNYCDVLYSYLQIISYREPSQNGARYVKNSQINFSKIGRVIGKTRQTVATKFKKLVEMGLLREHSDGYELVTLRGNLGMLIPYETLRLLVNRVGENSITIYVYLLNKFMKNEEEEFVFTYDQLKLVSGISAQTRSNDYIISDILSALEELELVMVEKTVAKNNWGEWYSQYTLIWAHYFIFN